MRRWNWIVALAIAPFVAAACGSSPPPAPTPMVLSIVVGGDRPRAGESKQFTAVASYSDGTTGNVTSTATWTSSVPGVATVAAGLVTGVTAGVTEIRAAVGAATGAVTVTIEAPPGPPLSAFMRDYIEALFFGTGPLAATDVPGCPFGSAFVAFAAGTRIDIAVSSTVPQDAANALNAARPSLAVASAGTLSATLSTTSNENPFPSANQVTVTMNAHPETNPGCFPQGCTYVFPGPYPFISSARSILQTGQTPNAYVHDAVGHGALGLCHVNGARIGGPALSLMSYGPGIFSDQIADHLTAFDLQATEAVYGSGLPRGATRGDFYQLGLINLPNAASATKAVPAGAAIPASRIRR